MNRGILSALAGVGAGLFCLLTFSAWMHIQALRLSYRLQSRQAEIDVLERREQALRRRLSAVLVLPRLDRVARERFGLSVPGPDRLRFLPEP